MVKFLDTPLIDLIEFGRHDRAKYKERKFARDIAYLACGVIERHVSSDELEGIRRCIKFELRNLKWNTFIWLIPLTTHRYKDGSFEAEGRTEILPNSIIATVLKYRDGLKEWDTNLAAILITNFVRGIGRICEESIFSSNIEACDNLIYIDSHAINKMISCNQT